jgi:DNA-binding winged helix-turn-helix (wHTH) protein
MDVRLLRWLSEWKKLEHFRALGVPRLMVLDGPVSPPVCVDALEDWARPPITGEDVEARTATLNARARLNVVPVLDGRDVLRFRDRWLALSPAEGRLTRALVESYRCVVPRHVLIQCVWPTDDRPGRNALDLRILRLRKRLLPLGLEIRTAWGQGYLLNSATAGAAYPTDGHPSRRRREIR